MRRGRMRRTAVADYAIIRGDCSRTEMTPRAVPGLVRRPRNPAAVPVSAVGARRSFPMTAHAVILPVTDPAPFPVAGCLKPVAQGTPRAGVVSRRTGIVADDAIILLVAGVATLFRMLLPLGSRLNGPAVKLDPACAVIVRLRDRNLFLFLLRRGRKCGGTKTKNCPEQGNQSDLFYNLKNHSASPVVRFGNPRVRPRSRKPP